MHRILLRRLAPRLGRRGPPRFFDSAVLPRSRRQFPSFTHAPEPKRLRSHVHAIGTIGVALTTALAENKFDRSYIAWYLNAMENACIDDDVKAARDLVWDLTRTWLSHHFVGPIVEEGPLARDSQLSVGSQLYAQDTNLFSIIPTDNSKVPVFCLSINMRFPVTDASLRYDLGSENDLGRQLRLNAIIKSSQQAMVNLTQRGHENFLLVVRTIEFMTVFYFDGLFHIVDYGDQSGDELSF